ncbi:hypothetical protein ZWY2020_000014 [Hordeum vulgare]|nr:hypothetical protein ZWY2020_000014 [Hordeum vulgare]
MVTGRASPAPFLSDFIGCEPRARTPTSHLLISSTSRTQLLITMPAHPLFWASMAMFQEGAAKAPAAVDHQDPASPFSSRSARTNTYVVFQHLDCHHRAREEAPPP